MSDCTCEDIIIEVSEEGIDGNGIVNIELLSDVLDVKTYRINFTNGDHFDYEVTDGSSIESIEKTSTDVLTDTYTITLTNGNTTSFQVVNGRGIVSVYKTGTSTLTDEYTILFNDGTTSTFEVTNGKGITKIEKKSSVGLVDTYRIFFNDATHTDFTVTNGQPATHRWIGTTLEVTSASGTSSADLKGDTGDAATIRVGSVSTGAAGSNASVTNSGDQYNAVFNFQIPRGDKGDKGDTGNVMFATFAIDVDTGVLSMTTPTGYTGPAFYLRSNGHMEVVI